MGAKRELGRPKKDVIVPFWYDLTWFWNKEAQPLAWAQFTKEFLTVYSRDDGGQRSDYTFLAREGQRLDGIHTAYIQPVLRLCVLAESLMTDQDRSVDLSKSIADEAVDLVSLKKYQNRQRVSEKCYGCWESYASLLSAGRLRT